MHPNCRSDTQLVLDSDNIKEEKNNNPEKPENSSKKDTSENEKPVLVETGKQKKGNKIPAEYIPFKNIKDAEEFALKNGVKYVDYTKMSLEQANEINKALLTIPINFRPSIIFDMKTAYKTEFIPKAQQRKIKASYVGYVGRF